MAKNRTTGKEKKTLPIYENPRGNRIGVTLPTSVAKALLGFASADITRFGLCGLSLSIDPAGQAWICSSDGHAAARMPVEMTAEYGSGLAKARDGVWCRDAIEKLIACARVEKSGIVTLAWDAMLGGCTAPEHHRVFPTIDPEADPLVHAWAVDGKFLARAAALSACFSVWYETPAIRCLGSKGEWEPVVMRVQAKGHDALAQIVIMPVRI